MAAHAEWLSGTYRQLISELDPELQAAGVYASAGLAWENLLQRTARKQLFEYEQQINDENLYQAEGLSLYAERLGAAIEHLGPLLDALAERAGPAEEAAPAPSNVDGYRGRLERLQRAQRRFASLPLVMGGSAARQARASEEKTRLRIERGVEAVLSLVRRHWREDLSSVAQSIYGTLVARALVHGLKLTETEIRAVLDMVGERDPQLLDAALFSGRTVQSLLAMGKSGFQAYRAEGEGFLSGVVRGSREDLLARPPGSRDFSTLERLEATAWFFAGATEGIGRSIIDNVKDFLSLFTPEFWTGLMKFFTEFLPEFITNEELRFQLGQSMGRFDASHERRLATAPPSEYGRTVGVIFGYAISEIVLSFVGLGWILKGVAGVTRLGRLSGPLLAAARRLGPAAVAGAGLRRAQAIAESLQALSRRLQTLRSRGAARGTASGGRTVDEATELERKARVALAAGDDSTAQQHVDELGAVVDDLADPARAAQQGPRGASGRETPSAGRGSGGLVPPRFGRLPPGPRTEGPGVWVTDVAGDEMFVDAQIAIALDRAARLKEIARTRAAWLKEIEQIRAARLMEYDDSSDLYKLYQFDELKRLEKEYVLDDNHRLSLAWAHQRGIFATKTAVKELTEHGKDPSVLWGPPSATVRVADEIPISPEKRNSILKKLEDAGVGASKGVDDRQIVLEVMLSRSNKELKPFASVDKKVINGLARLAGMDRKYKKERGEYKNWASFLHFELKKDHFRVEIDGFKLEVTPVQPIIPPLKKVR